MMTLITGLPGNGKTLYALQYVKAWAEREGRQVWYHGIKGLKLPWHVVPTTKEKINGRDEDVPQWWTAPANSIVVVDEAQMAGFGVRPRGQVPEWAQKLETHRHLGIDLVFITQDPSLIDSHDRKLCELHFHVQRKFGMQRATIHEFRPVRENVLKSRKDSIQHHWAYPKEAFDWYTSAEAHTHKRRIPMKVKLMLALPFIIGAISWFAWTRYLDPHRVKNSPGVAAGMAASSASAPMQHRNAARLTRAEYVAQNMPRVPGLLHTAPVYDEVTKPVEAPYPAACVSTSTRCQCYTQQGTKLDVPPGLCGEIAAGGFFVAWAQSKVQQAVQAVPLQAREGHFQAQGGVISLGGNPRSHFTAMTTSTASNITGNVEQAAPTNRPAPKTPS
jgi:zona occludens toxin (predicted ATPase)